MSEKWEYLGNAFKLTDGDVVVYEDMFNDKGDLGWELICILNHPDPLQHIAIFKRPKTETVIEVTEWENHYCVPDTSIGDGFMLRLCYNHSHPEESYYFITNHETGADIVVSFCPWCGEKL